MWRLRYDLISIIEGFNADMDFSLQEFGPFVIKRKKQKDISFFVKKTCKDSDDSDSDGMDESVFYYPNNYMTYYNLRQSGDVDYRIMTHKKWRKINVSKKVCFRWCNLRF